VRGKRKESATRPSTPQHRPGRPPSGTEGRRVGIKKYAALRQLARLEPKCQRYIYMLFITRICNPCPSPPHASLPFYPVHTNLPQP
jgi:hypothetical protein